MSIRIKQSKDTIRIKNKTVFMRCTIFTGKEDDYFVIISPSVNVSGYGTTEQLARESFIENIKLFCKDLLSIPKEQIAAELKKMGFERELYRSKNFSKLFVDENGILQGLQNSKVSSLEFEAA